MTDKYAALEPISFRPSFKITLIRTLYSLTSGLFGRGYNFAIRQVMRFVNNKEMTVEFSDGSRFLFDLDDFYWNRIVLKHYRYEPELEYAFKKLKKVDYAFLDCGANIGYWSVLVSSNNFGNKPAIAVEASPDTYQRLAKNCGANDNRFRTLNNAIYSEDGHVFIMSDAAHHAARQIELPAGQDNKGRVTSITLDSLVKQSAITEGAKLVIKLDVEGQEISALKGGAEVLKHDFLLIYEDHAKEKDHDATRYIMHEMGMAVFYVDQQFSTSEIEDISELDKIKVGKGIGYNFFACRKTSQFYDELKGFAG